MNKNKEKYLQDIYFNAKEPASFSGIDKIAHHVKKKGKVNISKREIKKWLQSEEVHTTNRLVNKKFKRRRVIAPYIDYMWDIDTASLQKYYRKNNGFGYFILAIDILSRFVWCEAIKTPSGKEVQRVLNKIFKQKRHPERLRSDKGSEFTNTIMNKFYKENNIIHFVTQNEVKANFSERCIQSIKSKIIRYMRANRTERWVDELQNITSSYNNTYHRSIKKTPASVSKKDESELWQKLYISQMKPPIKKITFKFEIGDIVRISKTRQSFQRYYSEHWTNELFIVKKRVLKEYIAIYELTDYKGEEIKGTFYENELQKVYVDKDTLYNVEKVEKRRQKNGVKESLIKWWGWPKKYNSWILSKDIINYK